MNAGDVKPPEQRVEAVERALTILNAFADGAPRMGLSALAARAGFYPSTVLRLSASLERFGYLHRDSDGDFRLGPALWRPACSTRRASIWPTTSVPRSRRSSRPQARLRAPYVREKGKRICLYRQNGPRMVRSHLDEGAELPLDRGAAGHILVAYSGEDSGKDSGRHAKVRSRGYAISKGEREPNSTAVAVPIFRAGGTLVGALGIVGPKARMTDAACRRALTALQAEARALSQKLGASGA